MVWLNHYNSIEIMEIVPTNSTGYWLFTEQSNIALQNGELPYGEASQFGLAKQDYFLLGQYKQQPLYLVLPTSDGKYPVLHQEAVEYVSLRSQLYLDETQFNLLGKGVTLNHFFVTHRFCGQCGQKTALAKDELAIHCHHCGYRHYPVICPSIIVAVRKGKQILLANHQRHKGTMYTTLAGFVEVGETFEQAVMREVYEECGIKVKNLRYFASQPWAFPNAMMVGYLADYASGDIVLQENELCDAKWFDYADTLPELPPHGTIARKLIEATRLLCKNEQE